MYPFTLPVIEPFTLPRNKGDVFEDSFDTGADGSFPPGWIDKLSGFTLQNGRVTTPDDTTLKFMYADWPECKDAISQMEYKRLTADTRQAVLMLRWDGLMVDVVPKNGYALTSHATSGIAIFRFINGITTNIASDAAFKGYETGILTFIARGSMLYGYLNDRLIISVSDTTHKSGKIGAYCRASQVLWFRGRRL